MEMNNERIAWVTGKSTVAVALRRPLITAGALAGGRGLGRGLALLLLVCSNLWACAGDNGDDPACVVADCDDNNMCTEDRCAKDKGCEHLVRVGLCDDGDECTRQDACDGGKCVGLAKCNDGNSCTNNVCDKVTGVCTFPAGTDDVACDDQSDCTSGDRCQGGKCAGDQKDCDDGKPCTNDLCDSVTGDCSHSPGAGDCDDDNPCTIDTCEGNGSCGHSPTKEDTACLGGRCQSGVCSAGLKGMAYIPAGTFWMGCDFVDAGDLWCNPEDSPMHEVFLSKPFWLDIDQITVDLYKECVDAGVCTAPKGVYSDKPLYNWGAPGRGNFPVTGVTWNQAKAYCKWKGNRLPTEAEWEMAARGSCAHNPGPDCKKAMRLFPWGNQAPSCKYAVMDEQGKGDAKGCGTDQSWAIGQKLAGKSPYGLNDMAGNAWDWVADCYEPEKGYKIYAGKKTTDPFVDCASKDAFRGFRGSSFYSFAHHVRASKRDGYDPDFEYDCVGFRCARSVVP